MTQMGIAEAERTGMPAPSGSAVKLRYSELAQEIADLTLRTIGRPALAGTAGRHARPRRTTCGRCSTRSRPGRHRSSGT